jgi:hypothetical protein
VRPIVADSFQRTAAKFVSRRLVPSVRTWLCSSPVESPASTDVVDRSRRNADDSPADGSPTVTLGSVTRVAVAGASTV